jgi:argininosuccinate synthase
MPGMSRQRAEPAISTFIPDVNIMEQKIEKVVLAYSAGLDTSVILHWIKEQYGCEVVTFTADLGQGEDLSGVEQRALRTGAVKAYVEDLCAEFTTDFIFPMMRANAVYEGRYLLGTSIARPLIARRLVEIARLEGAQATAHGATGKGNDQVRFELTAAALDKHIQTIGPKAPKSLYSRELATFEADMVYDKADAAGFIPLQGLRLRAWNQ